MSRSRSTGTVIRSATYCTSRDAVAAYRAVLENIDRLSGQAFNLGGGAGECRQPAHGAGRNRSR